MFYFSENDYLDEIIAGDNPIGITRNELTDFSTVSTYSTILPRGLID